VALAVAAVIAWGCRDSVGVTDEGRFADACDAARADLGEWVLDDEAVVPTEIEDPSGRALSRFRAALVEAASGRGQAHVVVYGGSHTAADLYTGTLRHALQAGFGDLGHGFVMPVPPFENYWQSGVHVEQSEGFASHEPSLKHMEPDRYGLAGMAFDASGPALAELHTQGSRASRVTAYFLAQPGGGTLRARVDGEPSDLSTVSAGETPEAASLVVGTFDGAHQLAIEAVGDGPVRLYGVALDREGAGVTLDQLGLAGAKARHQLLWDEEVWYALLASRRPDLLVLSYGNNETDDHHLADEEHVVHFERMLVRMRARFPAASCLVLGPADRLLPDATGALATPRLLLVLREAQRRIAHEHGCAFFDVMGWQGGPGAMARWGALDPPLAREDGIHFSERGYRRLGAALGAALLDRLAHPPASAEP
jgi:lysophospholipase L1-like esterase